MTHCVHNKLGCMSGEYTDSHHLTSVDIDDGCWVDPDTFPFDVGKSDA